MKWWHAHYYWGRGQDLVNAYCAFKRLHEMHGKKPPTHYAFRKAIVLAKICPQEYGSFSQRGSVPFQRGDHRGKPRIYSSKRSISSVATTESTESVANSKTRGAFATVKRLEDPGTSFQAMRLDRDLCHLPVPASKKSNCTLCRWATGNQYRAQIGYCEACKVNLCVWCFKTFHTEEKLGAKKEEICAEILARKRDTGTPASAKKSARKAARKSN